MPEKEAVSMAKTLKVRIDNSLFHVVEKKAASLNLTKEEFVIKLLRDAT